jgi:hypothetical protein
MRIFAPTRAPRSSTSTDRPRRPAAIAHINPAAPPPITITSLMGLAGQSVSPV